MRNNPKQIIFSSFNRDCGLAQLPDTRQRTYIVRYLRDLGASTVIEEPGYFDRDYLSEFSAFYAQSAAGYPNICRRLHFFSAEIDKNTLVKCAGDEDLAHRELQSSYLGFVVIRPIPAAPFGRTVLRWYEDRNRETPRIVSPSRVYKAHLAGIELTVEGLAWQQQDSGVGACATIGLWTMLHSSALDDHHAIPTTAQITASAHRKISLGTRMYPSTGLTQQQICESIKENGLAPMISNPDVRTPDGFLGFSKERFSSSCAAFIRSGYPVLIGGRLGNVGQHAVCAVGFRSSASYKVSLGESVMQDAEIPRLYVHDDNIGPNVRFDIVESDTRGIIALRPSVPEYSSEDEKSPDPLKGCLDFEPNLLLVASHQDIKTSPDKLHAVATSNAALLSGLLREVYNKIGADGHGVTASAQYMKLATYLGEELTRQFGDAPAVLSNVRLKLVEEAPPMSLHLGITRIGLDDSTPLVDILYDTTDSEINHPAFAHVLYDKNMATFMSIISNATATSFGVPIDASPSSAKN